MALSLQAVLEGILNGAGKVYFQPPANIQMVYPCVVFERYNTKTEFADNKPYTWNKRYQVTLIDKDPESVFFDKLIALPKCLHNRSFVADNLNHDVFNIYH